MEAREVSVNSRKKWENEIKDRDFVLDIGCWEGEKVLELLKKTDKVFGMDIDKQKISRAIKNPELKNRLVIADVTQKIPFKEGKFVYKCFYPPLN